MHASFTAGVIQATERDEFSYQEMITHLPLCALKVWMRFWLVCCSCGVVHVCVWHVCVCMCVYDCVW